MTAEVRRLQAQIDRRVAASLDTGFTPASSIAPKRVEWAWRPWLPLGFLTFVDGISSAGKSTLLADVIRSVTTGEPFAADSVRRQPGGAVVISEDPAEYVTVPRLIAAGANCSRVAVHEKRKPLALPRDVELIADAVQSVQARIVVLDPFVDYIEERRRMVVDQEMAPVLAALQAMAERHSLAIVLVRHWTKGAARSAVDRGAGGTRVGSACRVGWSVAPDPEAGDDPGARVLACAKSNLGPMPRAIRFRLVGQAGEDHAVVQWGEESDTTADALATGEPGKERRGKVDECADWLLGQLAGGRRIESGQIIASAKAAGFGRNACYEAKELAGVRASRPGNTGPWYWYLAEGALR